MKNSTDHGILSPLRLLHLWCRFYIMAVVAYCSLGGERRSTMNLRIGENIRRLRRQRDLTQEEVAAHLGISFQSISKWEREDGYPDITMLPSLANYFGISVDELIGMDEISRSERYDEINNLWRENNAEGLHCENVALLRSALKSFPNDALLLVQLATSLEKLDGTKEEKAKYLRESIAVQEQILRYGKDPEIRNATLYNICFAYWKNGEHGKALEQAEKLPGLYKTRENALVYFLQGQRRHDAAEAALKPLMWSIALQLSALAETEEEPAYYEKAEEILELLFKDREDDFVRTVRKKLQDRNPLKFS